MGFSLVAATAIVGVSILVSLEILTGSLLPAIENYNDAYDELVDRSVDRAQTDINITGHSIGPGVETYSLVLTVKNIGSVTLNTSKFAIMVNGTSYTFTYPDFFIFPENSVAFTVPSLSSDGYAKVAKVTTPNGISDYYQYTAPGG